MRVESVSIKNFKTFNDLTLELHDLNILIGANASGKSCFIQFFKFLKDIKVQGLENAISLQGGIEYLRNVKIGSSLPTTLELTISDFDSFFPNFLNIEVEENSTKLTYGFSLDYFQNRKKLKLSNEHLIYELKYKNVENGSNDSNDDDENYGTIEISKNEGVINSRFDGFPDKFKKKIDDFFPRPFLERNKESLMIESPYLLYPLIGLESLTNINFYDIDPKLPKKAVPLSAKADLEVDGSNLAIVLKNITKDYSKRKKLTRIMSDLLPFVSDIQVDTFLDKSFLFKVQELYSNKSYLPASLLSDGTIGITALIVALFFDRQTGIAIIEEPERNLHPSLISKVVGMMKDISKKKQLIITTHNVEVIKNSNIDDLLLISRNDDGFSSIIRPLEKDYIRSFLENELGIEDLYIQNIL